MENLNVANICKISATAFAGMFAGGALGINTVTMPSLWKINDLQSVRVGWKYVFLYGKGYQIPLALVSMVTGGAACYLDESDTKWFWLAGVGGMTCLFPWTSLVMISDINKLLKDDVIEERGEGWVRSHINSWDKQHLVRSVLSSVSFGIFLYALSRNK